MLRYIPFGPSVKGKCFTRHASLRFYQRAHRAFGRDITNRDAVALIRDAAKAVWLGLAKCVPSENGLWSTKWKGVRIVTQGHPAIHGKESFFCVVTVC